MEVDPSPRFATALRTRFSPRERALLEPASLERALLIAAAGAAVAFSVWTAWYGGGWNASGGDYTSEFAPAMRALLHARVSVFFGTLPPYGSGGSILLRAPLAGLGQLIAGGEHAAYRFGALECLLALDVLGIWLALRARARGVAWASAAGVLAVCAVVPALLGAVSYGHPEEALGAALCVGAVLATSRGNARLGGLLLGLALVNKAWGVLAIGPVLLSAPPGRRRELWPGAAVLGAWLLAAASISPSRLWQSLHGASDAIVAHPQDLWWPLARPDGAYRVPPALLANHARELAVLIALTLAAAVALAASRARRAPTERECLAVLAAGFALRCLLEPSAHAYYQLPLVVALAAWELRAWGSVALSAGLMILLAFDFGRLEEAGAGAAFALYLALLVPVFAILSAELAVRRGGRAGGVVGGTNKTSARALH